ncbi:MAG: pantetheine-phosphate adenylyltransferase [Bacteroidetes bacterium]|nr:MAG: pantetheine-phosphate adenylyltransferase [Bacteroidota bacterium]REK00356.1 MAG: pantetheine-phosphate adenylyltransferase [Bacteroidota bacterium]REK35475.1 MAG: pantetheine-phosphate adenylyltransferase [Bacteroidota bacterium]REK46841.1 MAG: pantetheine-phosphate adenylyltransferase [Bacteroidota bacterium]
MSAKRIAVFPGSFDPITLGHESIIRRCVPLFDEIVVGIGYNSNKNYYFSQDRREHFIVRTFEDEPKVKVQRYNGLTVDFCKEIGAAFILRGLRTSADFEFERAIAQMNQSMAPGLETIFVVSDPALSHISSTIVRDILYYQGDISKFVPKAVHL